MAQEVLAVEGLPPELLHRVPTAAGGALLVGRQSVAKARESAKNQVAIHVALARLPAARSELVVTLNVPITVSAGSSAARSGTAPACDEWHAPGALAR